MSTAVMVGTMSSTAGGASGCSRASDSNNATSADSNGRRWVWQTMPILSLPPVRPPADILWPQQPFPSKSRPLGLSVRLDSRVAQLKNDGEVMNVIRKADDIIRARRREDVSKWTSKRDFVQENLCRAAGPGCCRRKELAAAQSIATVRRYRRDITVLSRDATQRFIIAQKAMANNDIRARKMIRDRAFAELVYRRIFLRTGGNVRAWMTMIAGVKRVIFFKNVAETELRRWTAEMNESRIVIVSRFMRRTVVNRRRTRASNILTGALGAFTKSNAIVRYAKRVQWGSRHLQAVARRRAACTQAHVHLLSRHWDRFFLPPPPPPPVPPPLSPPSSRPETPELTIGSPTSPSSPSAASWTGQQSKRQRSKRRGGNTGGGGSGGGTKNKKAAKSRSDDNGKERRGAAMTDGAVDLGGISADVDHGQAKRQEIGRWLRRTREEHVREVISYERYTVFPILVELVLQYEPLTFRTRLQALNHVNHLRAHGCLYRVWLDAGYYAKVARFTAPPPRMPRLFSLKEGEAMFERASLRLSATSAPVRDSSRQAAEASNDGKNARLKSLSLSLAESATTAAAAAVALIDDPQQEGDQ